MKLSPLLKAGFMAFIFIVLISCKKKNPTSDEETTLPPIPTIAFIDTLAPGTPMKHVGGLHTSADFTRIKSKIASNEEPWISGWKMLTANSHAQLNYVPNPPAKLVRGGGSEEEPDADNYSRAFNDVAAAYQLALRWKISGDNQYAQKSIQILNAWASTCKRISGDSNAQLAAGIYGYQFALTGELMRDYTNWNVDDFKAYQKWMVDVFYPINKDFLERHNNTCDTHYWANWDLCNLASVMSIGILADNRSMYNYAVNYLQRGKGNGNWFNAINYVFDGENAGLAQLQESGRDQGHATLVVALLGTICQTALSQGDDFYSLDDNRFLKACEYTAKYNVARLEVPFHIYIRKWSQDCRIETYTVVSDASRGTARPMWSAPYFYYTKVKGISSQATRYTALGVQTTLPEGGGGDYGGNSGGFDQLGFGTLMYTR